MLAVTTQYKHVLPGCRACTVLRTSLQACLFLAAGISATMHAVQQSSGDSDQLQLQATPQSSCVACLCTSLCKASRDHDMFKSCKLLGDGCGHDEAHRTRYA